MPADGSAWPHRIRLKQWPAGICTTLDTPADPQGNHRVRTVAVDPLDPDAANAGSRNDVYACNNAVVRSTRAGRTGTNLRVNTPLSATVGGGPHEVRRIRPPRKVWASGLCHAMWKPGTP